MATSRLFAERHPRRVRKISGERCPLPSPRSPSPLHPMSEIGTLSRTRGWVVGWLGKRSDSGRTEGKGGLPCGGRAGTPETEAEEAKGGIAGWWQTLLEICITTPSGNGSAVASSNGNGRGARGFPGGMQGYVCRVKPGCEKLARFLSFVRSLSRSRRVSSQAFLAHSFLSQSWAASPSDWRKGEVAEAEEKEAMHTSIRDTPGGRLLRHLRASRRLLSTNTTGKTVPTRPTTT